MEWKDVYSLGIEEIDTQHRELISLFKRIVETAETGARWDTVHYQVMDLRRFAEFHFEFEEALMRMYGYRELDDHALSHQAFFTRLNEIEHSTNKDYVQKEMLRFLSDWLMKHILVADKSYALHMLLGASIVRPSLAGSVQRPQPSGMPSARDV